MGLFSKKKEPAPAPLTHVPSNGSTHSGHKLKLLLKPKQQPEVPTQPISLAPPTEPKSTGPGRRVSTIVEDEQHADFGGDDFADDASTSDSSSDYESEDDDYEDHTHALIARQRASDSQLSALMGLVGLSHTKETLHKLANEELKRTFSLISSGLKIHRLLPTMSVSDPALVESAVGDAQMELINILTSELNKFMDLLTDLDAQYGQVKNNRTLYDRYGNIKDVIGRGAYGVIKLIDPDDNADGFATKNKIYAVKELQRRASTDLKSQETRALFIERAVSEFIISSTLNNKHIVRTVDFLLTLPPLNKSGVPQELSENTMKISQVMDCTNGGDFFTYIGQVHASGKYISINEIDCMVKQISKGLWYMHNHGVAHCDLKLENILITYETPSPKEGQRGKMNLKISDFGKSNVVRTKWDREEQLQPSSSGPIGSTPFIAPEEYVSSKKGYSLLKKDCWALGVLTLVLFNVRRSYFASKSGDVCELAYYDEKDHDDATKSYSSSYLWRTTELKAISLTKNKKYKDEVFDEYVRSAMVADYDKNSREWTIQSPGKFLPIETLFDADNEMGEKNSEFEEDDFVLRKYFIYKLLDINPQTRMSVDMLLRSDWMSSVECCCE